MSRSLGLYCHLRGHPLKYTQTVCIRLTHGPRKSFFRLSVRPNGPQGKHSSSAVPTSLFSFSHSLSRFWAPRIPRMCIVTSSSAKSRITECKSEWKLHYSMVVILAHTLEQVYSSFCVYIHYCHLHSHFAKYVHIGPSRSVLSSTELLTIVLISTRSLDSSHVLSPLLCKAQTKEKWLSRKHETYARHPTD